MAQLTDIFGQPVAEGDYIAAGMSYGQSSVLRIGQILAIKETEDRYNRVKWSVRVRWRNNGLGNNYGVKESSIQYNETYSYAKFAKLPAEYVEKFPADIEHE